ncbi:hypothetical protein ACSTJ6_20310 [Vibrio parahaemolyticus]
MNSWLDFEHRFRTLAPVLQYHRLDDQTGAAGEWWRVAGQPCKSVEEFELLCELAGEQLIELLKSESEYGNIISGERPGHGTECLKSILHHMKLARLGTK